MGSLWVEVWRSELKNITGQYGSSAESLPKRTCIAFHLYCSYIRDLRLGKSSAGPTDLTTDSWEILLHCLNRTARPFLQRVHSFQYVSSQPIDLQFVGKVVGDIPRLAIFHLNLERWLSVLPLSVTQRHGLDNLWASLRPSCLTLRKMEITWPGGIDHDGDKELWVRLCSTLRLCPNLEEFKCFTPPIPMSPDLFSTLASLPNLKILGCYLMGLTDCHADSLLNWTNPRVFPKLESVEIGPVLGRGFFRHSWPFPR